jgi:hypothetical protein
MATNDKPELAILISSSVDRSYNDPSLKIEANVVNVEDGTKIRNLSTSGWDRHPAAGLGTSTYAYTTMSSHWDVEYRDTYLMRLEELEAMVKYLRKVSKALARMNDQRGYAESFAEQVMRFAQAVGAQWFVWKRDSSQTALTYDNGDYRITTDATIARNHVNSLIDTFKKEYTQS